VAVVAAKAEAQRRLSVATKAPTGLGRVVKCWSGEGGLERLAILMLEPPSL
jgi:hypothetical protein